MYPTDEADQNHDNSDWLDKSWPIAVYSCLALPQIINLPLITNNKLSVWPFTFTTETFRLLPFQPLHYEWPHYEAITNNC